MYNVLICIDYIMFIIIKYVVSFIDKVKHRLLKKNNVTFMHYNIMHNI